MKWSKTKEQALGWIEVEMVENKRASTGMNRSRKWIYLKLQMCIERHRSAQVVVDVEFLIKWNPIKGKGRSTSWLLVMLTHGETATAKKWKEDYDEQKKENMRHGKTQVESNQIKSNRIRVPHMMRSATTQTIRGRDAWTEEMRKLKAVHAELLRLGKPEEELPGAAEASSPE